MKNDATVIGLISFAHGMSHFYQLLLAPLFPFIREELGVSYAALGFLVALFYSLSALFQPIAGFVSHGHGRHGNTRAADSGPCSLRRAATPHPKGAGQK